MAARNKRGVNWKVLISCIAIVFFITSVGSLFTQGNTDSSWYQDNKPSFTPPNSVFPIVWPILYLLIALSLYFAWISSNKKQKNSLAWAFGINLIANAAWSWFFFGLQNPLLAFIDLLIILGTIVWMMLITKRIDMRSYWLLLPYLLWVIFAGILNLAFVI